MIREVAHIGVTVSDMDKSIAFYRDTLGLAFQGELVMQGEETDALFQGKGVVARVAYFNGSDNVIAPPIELICFEKGTKLDRMDIFKTSISEICLKVDDIDSEYTRLVEVGVEFLSKPQLFDFTSSGFGKSKAVYLRDPDGNILEFMQYLD